MLRCLCRNPCKPLLLRKAGFALLDRLERLEEARYLIASLSETFLTFGDYLEVTPLPLALSDIRRKLTEEPHYYTDVDQVAEHMRMVFENSARYYGVDRDSNGYRNGMKCLGALEAALVYLPYPIRPKPHPVPLQIEACELQFLRRRTKKRAPRAKKAIRILQDNKCRGRRQRRSTRTAAAGGRDHDGDEDAGMAIPYTEWRRVARAPTSRVPGRKLPSFKSQHRYHFYLENISASSSSKLPVSQYNSMAEEISPGWKCVVCDSCNRTGSNLCRFCWHRKKRSIAASTSSSLHLVSSPRDRSSLSSSPPTVADCSNCRDTTSSPGKRKKRNLSASLGRKINRLDPNQSDWTAKRHKGRK